MVALRVLVGMGIWLEGMEAGKGNGLCCPMPCAAD